MRLLKSGTNGEIRLTEDLAGDNIPKYAILSHTWGSKEVTFKDLTDGAGQTKDGYKKIKFCAEQALHDGIRHFWVDTCCIDKSTSDELQASINSMFRWYRDAARCYVYLSDVSITSHPRNSNQNGFSWEEAFRASRWFTRGWTLQELLAPPSVEFFTCEGKRLGDKKSLEQQLRKITGIPIPALQGARLSQFDVEERLAWGATRQTTRSEDGAYCLLGIFGVFMPIIYGEGWEHAMQRLRKEIGDTAKRQEWLRKLYTCPYRDRKDRNPSRIEGTCEWFTGHPIFRNWQQSNTSSLIWVSADPGCGKSVLAKYLVDDILPSTTTRTTCYFFFKDDFKDQRSLAIALCCILRQIFKQRPASFSDQILDKFEEDGEKLLMSSRDLWDILLSIASSYKGDEIVCILDALDECENSERNQLIDDVSKYYSGTIPHTSALKFLLTSRPYLDIKRGFQYLEHELPTIHLSGENREESGKISREIDVVIRSSVADISRRLSLLPGERDVLEEELTRVPNRTYLWLHLIFEVIKNSILHTPGNIRLLTRNIPQTVDETYERILSKSRDVMIARKLLHIIVAAARPLTLREMALALAIRPDHRSIGDLELVPENRFTDDIRELCGLFVVVVDSKIYLLHQTAREFLVPQLSEKLSMFPNSRNTPLQWKSSFHPGDSNRLIAEICMRRLSLSDIDIGSFRASRNRLLDFANEPTFLTYSAVHWADHFRQGNWKDDDMAIMTAMSYCRLDSPASKWFEIYQRSRGWNLGNPTSRLLVLSYFGLSEVLGRLPKEELININAKDNQCGRPPLSWASNNGYEAMVQRLLGAGANVHVRDDNDCTPLHLAAAKGHHLVAKVLLSAGQEDTGSSSRVDVNSGDATYGRTPLLWAARYGHQAVMRILLQMSIDVNCKDIYGLTPLAYTAWGGHEPVARLLLEQAAEMDCRDTLHGRTALSYAAEEGHLAMVALLLAQGTIDLDSTSVTSRTPLSYAVESGHEAVTRLLLESGANVNLKSNTGQAPVEYAVERGHETIAKLLLAEGSMDTVLAIRVATGHAPAISHKGLRAWESGRTSCTHLRRLKQTVRNLDPLARCSKCTLEENLWLCLQCGNFGCARWSFRHRGNGHALAHYDEYHHPVSVKFRTITSELTADIYCYACDDDRFDWHLEAHLAYLGLNVADCKKTEKSLEEMQREQDASWGYSFSEA